MLHRRDSYQPLSAQLEVDPAAQHLADTMDMLTDIRHHGSPWLGVVIAATARISPVDAPQESHGVIHFGELDSENMRAYVSAGSILLGLTDMEGKGIKLAKWMDPNVTTAPDGGERDHRADKRYVYNMLGGLAARAYIEGDNKDAAFMLTILSANLVRDRAMQRERDAAHTVSPDISTDAIFVNKIKTSLLMTGANIATTDWGNRGIGRKLSRGLLAFGTITGTYGYFKFRRILRENVRAYQQA